MMSEHRDMGDFLPAVDTEFEKALQEVHSLDAELLERDNTRQLVELGLQTGLEITHDFGAPIMPKVATGSYETAVVMSFHNGGPDGHTSVGPEGAGVPRNVLQIAKAVNEIAGGEVFSPLMRATAFCAAEAHDRRQLCGRTLLPEGQGSDRGDERLSAEEIRDAYLEVGGKELVARQLYDNVMATAFNPKTSAQNVNSSRFLESPSQLEAALGRELTAAADLFGTATTRGPLGAIEYSVESLCLRQNGCLMQERLRAHDIELRESVPIEDILEFIPYDEKLQAALTAALEGQAKFFSQYLRFSDEAIRAVCGRGIDDLSPYRLENAAILADYAEQLRSGTDPVAIWRLAKQRAGYE